VCNVLETSTITSLWHHHHPPWNAKLAANYCVKWCNALQIQKLKLYALIKPKILFLLYTMCVYRVIWNVTDICTELSEMWRETCTVLSEMWHMLRVIRNVTWDVYRVIGNVTWDVYRVIRNVMWDMCTRLWEMWHETCIVLSEIWHEVCV